MSLKDNKLLIFFILSYIISWSLWGLSTVTDLSGLEILGRFGPSLAALILLFIYKEKNELVEVRNRLFKANVNYRYYLISLLGPAIIVLPSILINQLITGTTPTFNDASEWYLIIVIFFYVLFLSVIGEEIGWRGYALPKMIDRFGALKSGIYLGIIWALWHLPLFFMEGEFHQSIPYYIFFIDTICISVIITWLFIKTKGSLLIVILFHTTSNVTLGIFPILPMDTNGDKGAMYIGLIVLVIATLNILIKQKSAK